MQDRVPPHHGDGSGDAQNGLSPWVVVDGIGCAQNHCCQADILQNDIRHQIKSGVFIAHGVGKLGDMVGKRRQIRLPLDPPDAVVETLLSD